MAGITVTNQTGVQSSKVYAGRIRWVDVAQSNSAAQAAAAVQEALA